ncbi:MAG: Na+/H+ antiporter NhaC family protein [Planctomycetota bacterium]
MSAAESAPESGRLPSTLVILGAILALAAGATLVLPRGEYERVERVFPRYVAHRIEAGETLEQIARAVGAEESLTLDGIHDAKTREPITALEPGRLVLVPTSGLTRTAIVDGSYRRIDDSGRPFLERAFAAVTAVVRAPIRGFVARAEVIAFVLLIGGAFGVILATGALDLALGRAVERLGEGRWRGLVVPISMLLFGLGGAIFGMGESTIAFVLVTIPLAIRLGYDTVTGIAMCYLASQIGFAGAFFNPFTVGIAQSIAELPSGSGLGYRVVTFVVVMGTGILFVTRHASRVAANPDLSPTVELDRRWRARLAEESSTHTGPLGFRVWWVVVCALSTVVLTGVGAALWDWFIEEMAALFVAAALLAGFGAGFRPGRMAQEFKQGAVTMIEPALIIALSAGIMGVLEEGKVLDTVLEWISRPLRESGTDLAAVALMLVQAGINFFVPSGSGQAALTMPIVTPLCDVIGLDRQVGVLAFQFGDGFGNALIPTSAVLMGVLGAARVAWTAWVRWAWRLILVLHLVGAGLLIAAVRGPRVWMEWPVS